MKKRDFQYLHRAFLKSEHVSVRGPASKWVEWAWLAICWTHNARTQTVVDSHLINYICSYSFTAGYSVMTLKSGRLVFLLLFCLNICRSNEQGGDLMELEEAEQERELVMAAIYKVAALSMFFSSNANRRALEQISRCIPIVWFFTSWCLCRLLFKAQGSSEKQRRQLRRMMDTLLRHTEDPALRILVLSDEVVETCISYFAFIKLWEKENDRLFHSFHFVMKVTQCHFWFTFHCWTHFFLQI